MNADFYYKIGTSHSACEDYALAGQINDYISYAIVCDGCSSSPNTDVGSRILAHSALKFLKDYYRDSTSIESENRRIMFHPFMIQLRNTVVQSLQLAGESLSLNTLCFDSTLLIAISDTENTNIYIYGDGGFIAENKSGQVHYVTYDFENNAPFYISYFLDKSRFNGYMKTYNYCNMTRTYKIISPDPDRICKTDVEERIFIPSFLDIDDALCPYNWCSYSMKDLKYVSIVSDGIKSYTLNGEKVDQVKMSQQYTAYKNFKGEFVKRRMNKIEKECIKENIAHYDDISVATIYMEN